jgi:hypothetical protein
VKALGGKLNGESAGTREAKEEEEEEEEKEEKAEEEEGEEKEEEEILGKVLEWGDPMVRRGPLQRPVRIKDWKIDPADLKWGAQLSRYSKVRAEQREQGKGRTRCRTAALHVPSTLARRNPQTRRGTNTGSIQRRKPIRWKGTRW